MQQTQPNLWQDAMNALNIRTPAQQARAKFYWHLFLLGVINAALALLGYADQFHTIKLGYLIVSVVSTGVMAILDTLREYYAATGQVAKVALASGAKAELQSRAPSAPPLDANAQAIESAAKVLLPVAPTPPVTENPTLQSAAFQALDSLPNIAAMPKTGAQQIEDQPTMRVPTPTSAAVAK